MSNIFINDTFIHSQETAYEYLVSLGFNKQDIESFVYLLCENELEEKESMITALTDSRDDFELLADGYYCCLQDCHEELVNIAENLETAPRNKPKASFAKDVRNVIREMENYV